jgi:hypothetical protein
LSQEIWGHHGKSSVGHHGLDDRLMTFDFVGDDRDDRCANTTPQNGEKPQN